MAEKKLFCTEEKIYEAAAQFGTPFHLYDEQGIRRQVRELAEAFAWAPGFREHYAVKALPNPYILEIMKSEGQGADCSSYAELLLAEAVGMRGAEICFTSNNTPAEEFQKACDLGATINLDDFTHIAFLEKACGLPEVISFRYNPGAAREGGNAIIGKPEEAKYGMTHEQLMQGIRVCRDKGVKRFGLHTMIVSNELAADYLIGTATMMFELAVEIKQTLGVEVEFINLGGGLGLAYRPEEADLDVAAVGEGVRREYERLLVPAGLGHITLAMESGRLMTGPHGLLVTRAVHTKDIYRHYIGVDACMAHLMRPALYDAYHHITVLGKQNAPADHVYDVVGSLCENNDKFAVQRALPQIEVGDLLAIHDSGAHGLAMGFNYNGKLRCQELLLQADGSIRQIRRAETIADLFATLDYPDLPME
ncbi:MAG: diaminopimelate decarboxylase [Firmicutes bacterium]|nr:diaminopimelate decarboxylase [Bacillota bacterium]